MLKNLHSPANKYRKIHMKYSKGGTINLANLVQALE
jgi:hypothetical protein